MKAWILSPQAMRKAEEEAFGRGVSAEDLMEHAGRGIAQAVLDTHPRPGLCVGFFGKGHNGGDVLVAARCLAEWGWAIELRPAFPDLNERSLTSCPSRRQPARSIRDSARMHPSRIFQQA